MPPTFKVRNTFDRTEQVGRNLQLAFALEGYRLEHGRYPAKLTKMPIFSINIMTSGVWKETPKTSGMKMAKPSHSLRRRSGLKPRNSLNHNMASIALGMTKNSQTKTPTRKRPRLNGRYTFTSRFSCGYSPAATNAQT